MLTDITRNDLLAIKGLIDGEDYETSGELLNSYLTRFPDDENGHFLLARIMLETNKPAIALALLNGKKESERWSIQYCLARAWSMLGKQFDALRHYMEADKLSPDNEAICHGISCCYVELRDQSKAIEWAERTLELNPDNALAKANIGYAALQGRDYDTGWKMYDHGIGHLHSRQERVYHGEPAWDGRDAKIVVYSDQGLGDQIAAVEALRDTRAEVVCLDVDPKLRNLFARNFPEIPVHGSDCPNDVDFHANLWTLHKYARHSESDYTKKPYLTPHPELAIMWRALLDSLGNKPKVGVAWSGGIPATHSFERRAQLDALLPILRLPCEWINLEYLDREEELADFDRRKGIYMHEWPRATRSQEGQDFEELAALVSQLDAVVSVPTTATHMAGALGVPTFCMVNPRPNVHYGNHGDQMPYYGSVRLFRRTNPDFWVETVAAVAHQLAEVISNARAA